MFELPSEDDHKSEDLLTRRANTTCLSEVELEDYLHDRLSGTTRESIEEHLLVCHACLDLVIEEESFAGSFRVAARRIETSSLRAAFAGPPPGRFARLWNWVRRPAGTTFSLVFAGAVATLALVALPALYQAPAVDVSLVAERGLASGFSAPASAGRRLRLNLDTTGLPETPLRLELAGPANHIIAGSTAASPTGLRWDLGRSLDKGTYWVRLYKSNPDTLLREFVLIVK
jgi:hypothetical protein